jgi:hypothetical protein
VYVTLVSECSSMPYTKKSLAMVWLIVVALFAMTGSGSIAGWWVVPLVVVALAAPALMLRSSNAKAMTAPSRERARIVSDERDRSPQDVVNVGASDWENEGGAGLTHVSGGIRAPASAGNAA